MRHEALNDAVEDVALVVQVWAASLAGADHAEVFSRQRHCFGEELEDDAALEIRLFVIAYLDVEEGLLVLWVEVRQLRMNYTLLYVLFVVIKRVHLHEAFEGAEALLLLDPVPLLAIVNLLL